MNKKLNLPIFLCIILCLNANAGYAQDEPVQDNHIEDHHAVRSGLRISGFGHVALFGQTSLRSGYEDLGGVTEPGALRISYGLEMRMLLPVAQYLNVGGSFSFSRFESEDDSEAGQSRSTILNSSFILQPRIPITLQNHKLLELGITIPIGMSAILPSTQWTSLHTGYGMHVGVLGSIQYFIAQRLLCSFETGWIQHISFHPTSAEIRFRLLIGQLYAQVGFGIRI